MFLKITRKDKRTNLEKEIDSALKVLSEYKPNTDEYAAISRNLEQLYKAKSHDCEKGVTPDTLAIIAGNLLGIVLILGYEKADTITSKALGFIIKGRV